MSSFLSKHQYLFIWVCGLVIIGAIATLILQLNQSFVPTANVLNQPVAPAAPPAPPAPALSLSIQGSGTSQSVTIQWSNLPRGTTALNIFRGKNGATSTWQLWKTISVPQSALGSGNATFNLTAADLGYQYYAQAVSDTDSTGDILWTSATSTPATSTPPQAGGNDNGTVPQTPPPPPSNATTSAPLPATTPNPNPPQNQSTTSTTTPSNPSHPGDPYYNPQVQVTGYGTANGSFWVEHVNQSVEVGWQSLPANTDAIIFYRSVFQDGPWTQFLEQRNPGSTGSYSLQIVDDSVKEPYYYQMAAFQGDVSSATYGPIYLPAAGQ